MACIVQIGPFPLSSNHIQGGVEASVFGLAKAQSSTHEVHVFDTPRVGGSCVVEKIESVIVHRFCNLGGRQFEAGRQVAVMANEIQELHPEICHIHGTSLFAWLIYRTLKRKMLPVIVTVHGLVRIEKLNALKKRIKIGILIDSDCDGYCSAAMMYDYITNKIGHKDVVYKLHEKPKGHGIKDYVIDWVKEEDLKLLIIPDAGCGASDEEGQKIIGEMGVDILILDHHIPEYVPCETTVIVNPHQQGDNYSNKYLSGAGVTHKFIEYHLEKICDVKVNKEDLYSDLLALSLVSDMMNLRDSIENRAYINLGKKTIKSHFICEIVDNKGNLNNLGIEDFGFSIAPLINATVRFGNIEERNMIFKSLFSSELVASKKRGSIGELTSIATEAVRVAGNLKRKQDKERDKGFSAISNLIDNLEISKNKVILLNVDNILDSSITGLVANKLVNKYNRPVILLKENEGMLGGSARTVNESSELKNFKTICVNTGLFEFCSGHEGSFGVGINPTNVDKVNKLFNEELKNVELKTSYEVDAEYTEKIPFSDIKTIADLKDLWCFHIKEPLFLVRDVKINTDDIDKIGNATYTFKFNKTIFTKFYGSKVWFSNLILQEELPFGGDIKLDLICKFRKVKGSSGETYIAEIVDSISSINNEYEF